VAEQQRPTSGDLSLRTLIAASVAGTVATALVSGVGIAGTLIGGAVFPVAIALAREIVLRTADRAPRVVGREHHDDDAGAVRAGGGPGPPVPAEERGSPRGQLLRGIPWRRVLVTGGAAALIVVVAFTTADLMMGESPVADRRSTFFGERQAPAPDAPTPVTEPGPQREEVPATTPTTPDPAEPAPPVTVPDPTTETAPTDPAEPPPAQPAPDPATGTEPPAAIPVPEAAPTTTGPAPLP
jgi:hypothetical protein